MAVGEDHGSAITGSHIRQSEKDVDLAATELIVVVSILGSDASLVGSRVQLRGSTLPAHIHKRLVDVEPIVTADESQHVSDPRRMVDESLEGFTHLEDLMNVIGY